MVHGVFHHQSTPAQPNSETLICRNSLSYIESIIVQEKPHPNSNDLFHCLPPSPSCPLTALLLVRLPRACPSPPTPLGATTHCSQTFNLELRHPAVHGLGEGL